ncbi:MAG: adenosylmethionine--8-amino-7-oxononanoate transaminase [Phycisphaeraceae bacterium]|nr:adenosylmethionine--8-amino-7-oxononanoate transaminase [Phycisphaeraceae bacterium]
MYPSLIDRDLAVLWHPCSQMRDYRDFPPLHVVAAKGSRLTLADGREVLDAISSWWCKALGHGHPRLLAALEQQARAFEHVILANTTNEPVIRLCERLLAMANGLPPEVWGPSAPPGKVPGHFGKVFLADNGSTAVEIALKMALQAQAQRGQSRRTQFACLQNAYHGETVGTLSVGDLGLYSDPYRPLMFPTVTLTGLPYRTGPDDPRWLDAAAEWPAIEAQLAPHADTLAAIIYEPVLQAAGGMRLYSPDLLRRFRQWADKHNVYLIADEIAAGFGRCGKMLAGEWAGEACRPDFVCLSKGLTAGVTPLSAVLTTDAVYDLFDADYAARKAFLHSNTYTGHALAVAVANAVLDVFVEERVLDQVAAHAPVMHAALRRLGHTRPYLHNFRGLGMLAAVDITDPRQPGTPLPSGARTGYHVYQEAVRRGALLRPLGDTMYLFPPLNTPPADLEAMTDILAQSLDATLG